MELNKIYKGDCYELIKQIEDKSVDLIITDPPYEFDSGGGGKSALSKRIIKTNYQDLKDINKGYDYKILDEFCRVMKHIYIYGAVKNKYQNILIILLKKRIVYLTFCSGERQTQHLQPTTYS